MPLPFLVALGAGAAAKYLLIGGAVVVAGTVAIARSQSEGEGPDEDIQRAEQEVRRKANKARKDAMLKAEKARCRRAKEDLDRRIQNFINFTRRNKIKGCCNRLVELSETKSPVALKRQLRISLQTSVAARAMEPNCDDIPYIDAIKRYSDLDAICKELSSIQHLAEMYRASQDSVDRSTC